jgi:G:T-mismatch repair DNA endonuclease (very short patch repair protein)
MAPKNKARDKETAHILVEEGWLHVEVWEHESPNDAALRVESIVRSRSPELSLRAAADARRQAG